MQMEIIVLPEAEGGAAKSRSASSLTSVQAVRDLECSESLAPLVINTETGSPSGLSEISKIV